MVRSLFGMACRVWVRVEGVCLSFFRIVFLRMRITSHDCVADRNLKEGASGVGFLYVAMEMEGRDFLPRSPLRHSQKPRSFHIIRLRAKGKQRGEHRGFGRQQAKQVKGELQSLGGILPYRQSAVLDGMSDKLYSAGRGRRHGQRPHPHMRPHHRLPQPHSK